MVKISLVIPARNEEKRGILAGMLDLYYPFFRKHLRDSFDFIVVVNGSTDDTIGLVKRYARKYKQIKVVDLKERGGKGLALMEGFKVAQGELIGFVDADGSTSPEAFFDLYRKLGNFEGIIASRWIKGAVVSPKQPFSRRFASRGFNFLVRLMFGITVHDTQCGAKLFQKKALKKVLPSLGITHWAFDIDLLYHFKRLGYVVSEIPTVWKDNESILLDVKRVSREMFLAIVRLRLLYSPLRFCVSCYDGICNLLRGKNAKT